MPGPSASPSEVPISDADRRQTMKTSIREGQAWAVMTGAGEAYIVPFAVALSATNAQVGMLSSLAGLLGAVCQLLGGRLVYRFRRRPIMVAGALAQSLAWMGLLGLAAWAWIHPGGGRVPLVILLYGLGIMAGSVVGPPWFSLIGDIVPEGERGRFFSRRNRRISITAMVMTLITAWTLDAFKTLDRLFLGFTILFAAAALGRLLSTYFLKRYMDPGAVHAEEDIFSFGQFLRRMPFNNFGRFTLYVGLINFATHFAAPFFAVYMLRDLQLDYIWFSLVNLSGGVFSFLSIRWWGRFGDRYGNRTLLKLGSLIIPFPPLFWVMSRDPLFLIFTAQLLAGMGWAAFSLAASNFIFDAVQPHRRALCVSYHTLVNGIGLFLGAFCASLVVKFATISWMPMLPFIFLLSCLLRLIFVALLLPHIREVRATANLRTEVMQALWMATQRPGLSLARGMVGLLNSRLTGEVRSGEEAATPEEGPAPSCLSENPDASTD